MYQLILLHSCDYLNKILTKPNVVTDKDNDRNEMWHWTNNEIGMPVQSWLWLRTHGLKAQSVRASERNSLVVGSNPIQASFLQLFQRILLQLLQRIPYIYGIHEMISRNHTMHEIFNRNTVKISYSCLRNISSIISSHNRKILSPKQRSFGCNCRVRDELPT